MKDRAKGRRGARWRLIWVLQMLVLLLPAGQLLSAVPAGFVKIPAGEFTMGSPLYGLKPNDYNETQHRVRVSEFYMGKYELTVGEFKEFVDATWYQTDAERKRENETWNNIHHSLFKKLQQQQSNRPVLFVSWNDAVAYCEWRSAKEGKTYRLPTEAEWEYACRAGTTTPFNTGNNLTKEQANFSPDGSVPVPGDSFAPNAWGLYNMHGNVEEWCSDWYGEKYYDECKAKGLVENPQGPSTGYFRVFRGGCWISDARHGRSASRQFHDPDHGYYSLGFRLVCVP